jgi:hypothetical protein
MIRLSFAISLLLLPLCDAESSSSPFFSFLRWERKRAQPDDSWIARLLRRFPGETADALRSAARHLRAERWVVDAGACSLEVDNFQLVCAENEEEGSGVDDAAGNYSSSSSSSSSNNNNNNNDSRVRPEDTTLTIEALAANWSSYRCPVVDVLVRNATIHLHLDDPLACSFGSLPTTNCRFTPIPNP